MKKGDKFKNGHGSMKILDFFKRIPSVQQNNDVPLKKAECSKSAKKISGNHATICNVDTSKLSDLPVLKVYSLMKDESKENHNTDLLFDENALKNIDINCSHDASANANRSSNVKKRKNNSILQNSPKSKSSIDYNLENTDCKEFLSPLQSVATFEPAVQTESSNNDIDNMENTLLNKNEIDFNFSDYDALENDLLECCDNLDYLSSDPLDLTEYRNCIILNIAFSKSKIELKLRDVRSEHKAICDVEGFWSHSKMEIGDEICICAEKIPNSHVWKVSNEVGFIIYQPNFLVSSTTVARSLFCKRRTILSEHFSSYDGCNRYIVIGKVVHSLLQTVLKAKIKKIEEIQRILNDLVKSPNTIHELYESGLTLNDIISDLNQFPSRIAEFMQKYFHVNQTKKNKSETNWSGSIQNVIDIEENIWCPQLGLKGKVDVTIETGLKEILPLEVKTGKSSFSIEHRGQVVLYIMMMTKLGYKVSSGLLLYLRDGSLKEISTAQREERDLLLLRNEIAYYLTRHVKLSCEGAVSDLELPPPIVHYSACEKCPFNRVCTIFLKSQNYDFTQNPPLSDIAENVATQLTSDHIHYFIDWTKLVDLENQTSCGFKKMSDIYTVSPEDREKSGKCLINMKISSVIEDLNGLFEHTFATNANTKGTFTNLALSDINIGAYIIISTDQRPAVGTGFVTLITNDLIVVTLETNLTKKWPISTIFHLDTYDSSTVQSFNLSNLALLMEETPRAERLRALIIDKKAPEFQTKVSSSILRKCLAYLARLNYCQQKAVLTALTMRDYLLIQGMPGTGKTETIIVLIQVLVRIGYRVLITSHTHAAIDNICLKLIGKRVDFMRLGAEQRIHSDVRHRSESQLTKHCESVEDLELVYKNTDVVAVTCLGAGHPLISRKSWDVCIVDEASQVLQPTIFRAIYSSKSFILIGDDRQLPPIIRNKTALKMGMSESLFQRLSAVHPAAQITLTDNYRMNKWITKLASSYSYNGELKVANKTVGNAVLDLDKVPLCPLPWLEPIVVTKDPKMSVQFINTGPVYKFEQYKNLVQNIWSEKSTTALSGNRNAQEIINPYETALVTILVRTFLNGGLSNCDIGVISTYKLQVIQIANKLQGTDVNISTVDQFQGTDKKVLIYSTCMSRDMTKEACSIFEDSIINDKRRINVAITRAKQKLIIIGDLSTLQHIPSFRDLFKLLEKCQIVNIEDLCNFNWGQLFSNST